MFAGTKDQLTELCLKKLMENQNCCEKLIVESIEPTEKGTCSVITLSHKFKVPVGQPPSKTMEVRCLTSWVPLREAKGKPGTETYQEADVPLRDIFEEDKFVLRKLRKQFRTRYKLGFKYEVRDTLPKERVFQFEFEEPNYFKLGTRSENAEWGRVREGKSYLGALPMMYQFSNETKSYYYYPPGEIVKFIDECTRAREARSLKAELSFYSIWGNYPIRNNSNLQTKKKRSNLPRVGPVSPPMGSQTGTRKKKRNRKRKSKQS